MKGNGVGPALAALRDLAGMSVEEVAAAVPTSSSHLALVESGERSATPAWLGLVSEVCARRIAAVAIAPASAGRAA